MALALYRRYRPDTFDKVIGQDQVTVPLSRALDRGRITHAYLFSGPRGCGKTSSARILARCINCAQGPTSHPCGECESCKDLANGGPGSIDVVEIDAASHNGVEDARELRERATFAPARDRYKIFILDEAHMVTQQGFNALLKIVEEPPEHVMFIFATTEPDKVIGTIRSRTHHYPFRLVPQEIMGPYLEKICEQEQIRCEPGVLKLTMRAGGGSVRDTLSILDQLMVGSVDGVVSHDVAVSLLGFTPEELITQAIDGVVTRNGEQLYGVVQKVVIGGFDPRRFMEDLLARVRDLLVLTIGGEHAESVLSDDAAVEDIQQMHEQAAALGLANLSAMADTIDTALAGMNGAVSPRMRLELLAARLLAGRNHQHVGGQTDEAHGQTRPAISPGHRDFTPASQRTGFAGVRHGKTPVSAADTGETQTNPVHVDADHAGAVHEQVAPDQQQIADSGTGHAPDTRSVEERWDAVLAALPNDVREYVTHDKVSRVALSTGASGRTRLSMTFDRALSQHAFALAVSSDAEHNGDKASSVVLQTVREVFGAQVMIAPTKVAANGEQVEPTSRMAPEQLAQVKRQIALAKAGLAAAGLTTTTHQGQHRQEQGSEPRTAAAAGTDADDPSHPRAASSPAGGPTAVDASGTHVSVDSDMDADDPWFRPIVVTPHADPPSASGASSASNSLHSQVSGAFADGGSESDPGHGNGRSFGHHKVVAVPDMSNDDDPWAITVQSAQSAQSVQSAQSRQSVQSAQSLPAQSNQLTRSQPVQPVQSARSAQSANPAAKTGQRAPANSNTASSNASARAAASPQPQQPSVAPEDDEYSLSDESLNSSTVMDIADIAKLFDVKQVEDFSADDPQNPKNAQPANKHQEG